MLSNVPLEGQLTKPWGKCAARVSGTLRSSGSWTVQKEEESSALLWQNLSLAVLSVDTALFLLYLLCAVTAIVYVAG